MELNDSISSKGWYKFLVFVLIIAFFVSISGPKIDLAEYWEQIQSELESELEDEYDDEIAPSPSTTTDVSLGDTFTYKDFKITIGDEYYFKELNSYISDEDLIVVPITIENVSDEPSRIGLTDIHTYSANETTARSASFYNSTYDASFMNLISPEEAIEKEISFYYTGEGEYRAEFRENIGQVSYNLKFWSYE